MLWARQAGMGWEIEAGRWNRGVLGWDQAKEEVGSAVALPAKF